MHDLDSAGGGGPVCRAGLLPVAAGLFAYTSIPTFKNAREVLFEEKRLGVDVLDAIVVLGCLGTLSIFPGAVLCWCLGFGRVLVKKTQDNSKKLLLNAFGKQPRFVWLYRDGVEVQVALDRLQAATSSSSTPARWSPSMGSSPKVWR